ncbi:hypothetical protein [Streptomyces lydicus]|uniref:hypothetical protein n=1 Tax=Streptomyces lydicus TaxID=47763 RepID=UPI0037A0474C
MDGDTMGDQEAAAAGMRHLRSELTAMRPRAIGNRPQATRVHGQPPCDIDLLDHLISTRADLIETTRLLLAGETSPPPTPIPTPPVDEGIFQWAADATAHLAAEKQLVREAVAYSKHLQQKVLTGDRRAVRRERCPACQCFSLLWKNDLERAVCIQDECRDELGRAHQWELRQLAHHHVTTRPRRAAN